MNTTAPDLATVLAQPAGVAAGWVLVPVEPTEAMFVNAEAVNFENEDERAMACNIWSAMLAAAPPAPSLPADRDDTAALVEAADWAEAWLSAAIERGDWKMDASDWEAAQTCRDDLRAALANRTPPQPASDEVMK